MRKLFGIALLPLLPLLWLFAIVFWPALYDLRNAPLDHMAAIWHSWMDDFWRAEHADGAEY